MLSFLKSTPSEMQEKIRLNFKQRRKTINLTQPELSAKSGVSFGSIKRFEQSGKISFESLLQLAFVLECLDDFEQLCSKKDELPHTLENIS